MVHKPGKPGIVIGDYKRVASNSSFSPTTAAPSAGTFTGLYIHIPFCLHKCPYCDFYSITDLSRKPAYIDALIAEIDQRCSPAHTFDTVYIGGGTPSTLTGNDVKRILAAVNNSGNILPGAEITLEVNPGTVTHGTFAAYRQAGITRISIGVQSFNDRLLGVLGRIHTAAEARQAIDQALAADFNRVGMDLIYGIPDQSMTDLDADLDRATGLGMDHLSGYMLSFEPGTRLEARRRAGHIQPLADTVIADMYRTIVSTLARRGYRQYEISNFARTGCRSRHNAKYWTGAPYIGLGAGAHSFDGAARSWNDRDIDLYIQSITAGRLPVAGREKLTPYQQMLEAVLLGLRTTAGIDKIDFSHRFNVDFNTRFDEITADLRHRKFIDENGHRLALTMEGMLRLDAIVAQIAGRIPDYPVITR